MHWRLHGRPAVRAALGLPLEGWVESDSTRRGGGKSRAPQEHEGINGCGPGPDECRSPDWSRSYDRIRASNHRKGCGN